MGTQISSWLLLTQKKKSQDPSPLDVDCGYNDRSTTD